MAENPRVLNQTCPYRYRRKHWKYGIESECPLVWKTWKCQGIGQLSGKCQGFYKKSGKCQGKILSGKSCQKMYGKLHKYRYLVGVYSVLNIKYMISDRALLHSYPTIDSTGMIWVTLNMPSAANECCEPSRKCQRISHCLESDHPVECHKSCNFLK